MPRKRVTFRSLGVDAETAQVLEAAELPAYSTAKLDQVIQIMNFMISWMEREKGTHPDIPNMLLGHAATILAYLKSLYGYRFIRRYERAKTHE